MLEIKKQAIKMIAIYARVSTARQEEEKTIGTQLAAVREFSEKNGYTIVKEYIDDGWSGDILARPQLDQLRQDTKNKTWEAVLIYDPDRLARRYSYQELLMDELQEAGIEVLFVTTPAPKNGEEKILHGVKGLFAEYERAKIAERFRLGKMRKVKEGHLLVSEAPYGYTYILKEGKQHGYYKINELEANVLKQIFSWIADEKLTMRAVIRRLQELGIAPRKSKRGVWNISTLSTLLRNKTYIGEAHYGASYAVIPENPNNHEKYKKIKKTSRKSKPEEDWIKIPTIAIIDEKLFYRAQEQLKKNITMSSRNKKNDYLLSGLIRHACGSTMAGTGLHNGKHLYYRCTERINSFPLPPKCINGVINARIADELAWEKIENLLQSPKLLIKEIKRWAEKRKNKTQNNVGDIRGLEMILEKLKAESDRYTRAYGADVISIEQLKVYIDSVNTRTVPIKKQIADIKNKQGESENISTPITKTEISQFVNKVRNVLPHLNFAQKRAIIVGIVNKVVVNNAEMLISGRIPVNASLSLVGATSMPYSGAERANESNNTNGTFSSIRRNCGITQCR
jgi:site-specific DNA recombinase